MNIRSVTLALVNDMIYVGDPRLCFVTKARGRSKTTCTRFGFFDHLPPSVYIFFGIKVYKKSIFLTTYLPPPLVNVVCEWPLTRITILLYCPCLKNPLSFHRIISLHGNCEEKDDVQAKKPTSIR